MSQGLEFLQELVNAGRGYSRVNVARSALSTILRYSGVAFGSHPDVTLFMKGVYNLNPPMPRYVRVWDPSILVNFVKTWSPAHKIPLDKLVRKLVILILLVTGQRPQILLALTVDNMQVSPTHYEFRLRNQDLKQGRLRYKPEPLRLKKFAPDKRLCVHHYMGTYLTRTLDIRGTVKQVVLTTKKPFGPASLNTMSRWVKETMAEAGIDTGEFKPGSTRHATMSQAARQGIPLADILSQGGWSTGSVFAKYYNKPLVKAVKALDTVVLA